MWRALLDAGAVIANGTDAPVEDVSPIASYYSTVTRRTKTGEAFYPGQAMSRMEALQSYTIWAAQAAFEDGLKGSLTPGKEADIIVLTGDPYQIDNPYVDSASNGLSYVVEKFKNEPISGHVTLQTAT